MSVKTYSLKNDGSKVLSKNFKVCEFKCKDGSDKVLYSTELMAMLEKLRAYGGFTISINSGYRTPAYNRKIGGASKSQHTLGTAADIVVKKGGKTVSGKLVCCLCQYLGFKGIGYISERAVHVDMRESGSYRGDERKGYSGNVGGNFFTYFNITKSEIEAMKVKEEVTQQEEKKGKENEMIYKDITEVPDYGKESVQLRVSHGWTDGKNLTDSMVRCWVVEDRENPYIVDLNDVPAWALMEVRNLIDKGKLKGNGVEPIGKRWNTILALMMAAR